MWFGHAQVDNDVSALSITDPQPLIHVSRVGSQHEGPRHTLPLVSLDELAANVYSRGADSGISEPKAVDSLGAYAET